MENVVDEKELRRQKIITAPLLPLLIKMAIPTMIGMLVSLVYNLTDTFFVGKLGDKSMTAAIGIVFAFVSFIQALGFWFGYGSGNTMSRLLGNKDEDEAKIIAADGAGLAVIVGTIIMVISLIFIEPLASFIGGSASEKLLGYTVDYLRIMLYAVPATLLSATIYNQIRLCGNVKDAMIGLLSGMLCNILLDPVFILGLGMGIKGAGYASLIGMSLAAVIVIWLSYIHGNIPVNIKYFNLKGNGRLYHILAGGAPNFSRQAITSVASVLLNLVAAKYGETLIAAMTIATRVTSLGYMLMIGFGQGFQPICAMNYGAKKYKRVKEALKLTVIIGTFLLIFGAVALFIGAYGLAGRFSQNEDVVILSAKLIRYQCLSLPLLALYAISSMFLQNIGKYFSALFISVARQGLFYVPLLFGLNLVLGEFGIYIVQSVADILSVIFAVLVVIFSWNKIFED